VAELPAPRLQHLARRKLLEDQWTGEWEAWLMGLVSQRFPQSLDKLSLPLRRRLEGAVQTSA
ncbi:MAG TPA: hypothetical protein VLU25_03940, partial [Acidobacteriota bacterium]|nr:hypothetical protein [Acidobacteriota bacterium]